MTAPTSNWTVPRRLPIAWTRFARAVGLDPKAALEPLAAVLAALADGKAGVEQLGQMLDKHRAREWVTEVAEMLRAITQRPPMPKRSYFDNELGRWVESTDPEWSATRYAEIDAEFSEGEQRERAEPTPDTEPPPPTAAE